LTSTPRYQFLLKSIVYLLLIGQIWTNTVSHCHWMFDCEIELTECTNEEKEGESEKENKKEKDNKLRLDFLHHNQEIAASLATANILHLRKYLLATHQEIPTPPPERFFFV